MNKRMLSAAMMTVGLVVLGACDDPAPSSPDKAATFASTCEVDITYCEP